MLILTSGRTLTGNLAFDAEPCDQWEKNERAVLVDRFLIKSWFNQGEPLAK